MQGMATRHPHTGAPSRVHSLLEWRAFAEMATLPFTWPLLSQMPPGDGQPVLLLPGFMGDEGSLVALKTYLAGRGYAVQTWGLGRNIGFQRRHAQALEQKIRHLHHTTGRRVSLVGWSLGGVFGLYGALQATDCVRQLITLGSPVNVGPEGSQASPLVKALYRMVAHPRGAEVHVMQPRAKPLREHLLPAVPMSCLYTLSDGVVPPQEATIDGPDDRCENIRVTGSHTGLGFNPMVLAIVADRLAQPEGRWQPFNPAGLPGALYRLVTHAAVPL
jgi:pimeloyl-ACP methyl ester carboxylesterase